MEEIVIDKTSGVVQRPHVHDATLFGINVLSDAIELRFRTSVGRIVLVILHQVRGLSLNSFFEKNILFEMKVSPWTDATHEELCSILHLGPNDASDIIKLQSAGRDKYLLVRFAPTLGAEILAICRSVTWAMEA